MSEGKWPTLATACRQSDWRMRSPTNDLVRRPDPPGLEPPTAARWRVRPVRRSLLIPGGQAGTTTAGPGRADYRGWGRRSQCSMMCGRQPINWTEHVRSLQRGADSYISWRATRPEPRPCPVQLRRLWKRRFRSTHATPTSVNGISTS